MKGRIGAAVAAVVMVVGALVVRTELIEGGGGARTSVSANAAVLCATDLPRATCGDGAERLDIEAAAQVLIDSEDGTPPAQSAWVTLAPWPEIVDEARAIESRGPLFGESQRLASTPLVAVIKKQPPQCPAEITWKCLGDAAQASDFRVAAGRGGERLLIRAAFAAGYLGRTDFASNDLRDDPAASDWLAAVERGIQSGRSFGATSLRDFLVKPGSADVFITTAAEARDAAIEVANPTPVVRVTAVVGVIGRRAPSGAAEALEAAGWGPPGPAAGDGLPSPGVLLALREVGA